MVARLNDVVEPSRFTDVSVEYLVDVKEWPNGQTSSRLRALAPLRTFTVEFDGLSLAKYQQLLAHYDSARGRHLPFPLRDNHTNTEYNVRYLSALPRQPSVRNVRGLYSIEVQFREDR